MIKSLLISGIISYSLLIAGCGSDFHPYDGHSGYRFTPLGDEQYRLDYVGTPTSAENDLRMMWHHAARERCRGGSYEHNLSIKQAQQEQKSLDLGNTLLPNADASVYATGHLHCLAPNYALKQPASAVEHLATH